MFKLTHSRLSHSLSSLIVAGMVLLLNTVAQAEAPAQTSKQTSASNAAENVKLLPRFKGAGAVYRIDGAAAVDPIQSHKLVLDVTAAGPNDKIHSGLEHAARALNLYSLANVPEDKVSVAVVIHSKATPIVLSDAAYRLAFDMPNPNSELLRRLKEAGVDIRICGQALRRHGFHGGDVASSVNLDLSAMTALVELHNKGYALIPD